MQGAFVRTAGRNLQVAPPLTGPTRGAMALTMYPDSKGGAPPKDIGVSRRQSRARSAGSADIAFHISTKERMAVGSHSCRRWPEVLSMPSRVVGEPFRSQGLETLCAGAEQQSSVGTKSAPSLRRVKTTRDDSMSNRVRASRDGALSKRRSEPKPTAAWATIDSGGASKPPSPVRATTNRDLVLRQGSDLRFMIGVEPVPCHQLPLNAMRGSDRSRTHLTGRLLWLLSTLPAPPRLPSAPRVGKLAAGRTVELFEQAHLVDGTTRMHTEEGWVTYVTKEGKVTLTSFTQLGKKEQADLDDALLAALIPTGVSGDGNWPPPKASLLRRERWPSSSKGSAHEQEQAAAMLREASLRVEARMREVTDAHSPGTAATGARQVND